MGERQTVITAAVDKAEVSDK